MNQKYFINLSREEQAKLQEISNSNHVSKTIRKRANVLLMSDIGAGTPGKQEEIAKRCGVSVVTVFHTVKDFCHHGMEYTLSFKREKATNPPIVTGGTEARIIALACSQPPDGYSRWTVRLLTDKVVELAIMDTVSRETVRQTLKKRNLNLT